MNSLVTANTFGRPPRVYKQPSIKYQKDVPTKKSSKKDVKELPGKLKWNMPEKELKLLEPDQLIKLILKLQQEIERLKIEIARLTLKQNKNKDPELNSVLM